MNKIIDLVGQKFGRWLVIEKVIDVKRMSNGRRWLCQCDCGTKRMVYERFLKDGQSKSCGCLQKEMLSNRLIANLIGQRFGRLLVIKYDHSDSGAIWKCICDCGNEILIKTKLLTSCGVKSCGCIYTEKDLTGKRFGKLHVISKIKNYEKATSKSDYYLCMCDCGNETIVLSASLRNGNTKSCGCLIGKTTNKLKLLYGEASFNQVYNTYVRDAKKRNLVFELDNNIFKIITQQNCYYCDNKPNQIIKSINYNGEYIYNGIDRLNNSLGYIVGNIVPCCGICNRAKRTMGEQEFYNWIEKVYSNLKETNRIIL
jgi:hypothetical protein